MGHFRPAATPVTSATASTTATPVEQAAASPTCRWARPSTPTPADKVICDRGGVDQLRPCLPRPAVCDARRSAPRRRCPHLRRPARAGRRWWSPSRRRHRRRHATRAVDGWSAFGTQTSATLLSIASSDHDEQHQGHDRAHCRAVRRAHESTSTPPRASWPTCASGPRRRCIRSVRQAVEKVHAKGKLTARERILRAARRGLVRRTRRAGQAPQHELRPGRTTARWATAWSPATAPSTAATSASSARTPRCSAAASARCTARRSSRCRTWPSRPAAR